MSKVETMPSSKRFVKEHLKTYRTFKTSDEITKGYRSENEALLPETFSLAFSNYVILNLVRKGASFGKVRDVYEKTISELVTLSRKEEDPLAKKVAARLVSSGEHVLQNLNPEFDSGKWHDRQMAFVYPQYAGAEPSQTASFK